MSLTQHGTYRHVHDDQTYVAQVTWDREARLFHGEVANLRDIITFQSREEEGLASAFEESVLDYLTFCAELGRAPETSSSGLAGLK
jgi:predicted HicB family RNase H-like nuclease